MKTCKTCSHVINAQLWAICSNRDSHLCGCRVDPGADSCGEHPDRKATP